MADSYRSVMEVLKCADAKSILTSAAVGSSLWACVCDSSELWQVQMDTACLGCTASEVTPGKLQFYSAFLSPIDFCLLAEHPSLLRVYSFPKQQYIKELPIQDELFHEQCAAAFMSKKVVFVCGGKADEANTAALLSLWDGTSTRHPSMEFERFYHSAVYVKPFVYVFGGQPETSNKSAERFDTRFNTWKRLPNMNIAHSSFTACVKDKEIYLCGGHTQESEVFTPDRNEYRRLPFLYSKRNWTVSFVYRDELVTVIGNSVYFLKERELREETGSMVFTA